MSDFLQENKNVINTLKAQAKEEITPHKRNIAFVASILGLFLFTYFAVQILTGLIALVAAAIILPAIWFGFYYIRANDKYIKQRFRNAALARQIKEASENADVQLQNMAIAKEESIKVAANARDMLKGAIRKIQNEIKNEAPDSPVLKFAKENLAVLEPAAENASKIVELRNDQSQAFKTKVEQHLKMKKISDMANQVIDATSATFDNALDNMLSLTAFEAIEEEFYTATIKLESSVEDALRIAERSS
ncbi:hypothetical protein [Marinicellulosiphila megalodicopiae]|uniref:hypothetical protein n=1 Tax=Marinicellulosiphila megalodicopiae TaxID=2724896 RepID=UPI003BB098A8